eukprot:TRINITY_DN19661_c0_g1::TRINITY_DN19661_c0_g1_i1::g.3283::m.3283 TRINITY_DN19661_c0_g1::TRINITY_DN19661_c0_g1_i1::g.3283  ORF type:complete len:199 (-),score=17.44,sp/Q3ZCH9/HDHD2_BOVIN/49.46/6e-56,Hydrolase_like/PF13242.1/3.9e-18,HAD_2/PF13419.1/6.7e-09,Hydrolase/PF00702.21/4.2e-07 TRINITY_DN19661_c0_g1_i1:320-916(-)
MTVPVACKQFLEKENLRPFLVVSDLVKSDFDGISTAEPNAVVIGLKKFHYDELNEAFRILKRNKDARIIAMNRSRYFQDTDGDVSMGSGGFVSALEFASERGSEIIGKPSVLFFRAAVEHLGVNPDEVVMIGDDIRDDVLGAQDAGLRGILVQTGKYRAGDETKAGHSPNAMCASFAAAVDWIIEHNKRTLQESSSSS